MLSTFCCDFDFRTLTVDVAQKKVSKVSVTYTDVAGLILASSKKKSRVEYEFAVWQIKEV